MLAIFCLLLFVMPSCLRGDPDSNRTYVRACYLSRNVPLESIPAQLCTHLLAVFGQVTNDGGLDIKEADLVRLANLTSLRNSNPELKVLLTVTGSSDNFAAVAASEASRDNFSAAAVRWMTSQELDGLDVNWEFPAFPPWQRPSREKRDQTLLLRALSAALHAMTPPRLLMAAVGAPPTIVAASYDVPGLAAAVDFASIMAYDLHFYQALTPFTGYNAPLHASRAEVGYFAKLNTESVTKLWLSKGLPAEKTLVGIPTYGRGWKLLTARWHGPGALAVAQWGGGFTSLAGVCNLLRDGGTRRWDSTAKVPYAFKGRQWVSYDDAQSVAAKAAFVREVGAAGAMVFILDNDDWGNECGDGEFPLTNLIKQALP